MWGKCERKERGNHKREKKQMGGETEPQRLYLGRKMKSPLVTHLLLVLCVSVYVCMFVCLMSITAEALGFRLSTTKAFWKSLHHCQIS